MNQFDWERMQENVVITHVARITNSSWFATESEYTLKIGNRITGTYTDTKSIDGNFETFKESLTTFKHEYAFKSSDIRVSTTSGTPVDDAEAVLNITLDTDSQIFIIYNAGNKGGSAEDTAGKGCAINVDGEDKAFSWQSSYAANSANSVTVVWATSLPAGFHIVQGRFFANRPGYTVGIDTRQIVAYWFPTVVAEYIRSTVSTTTTSNTPVDDTEAVMNITLDEDSVAFILYNAGNKLGSDEPQEGKGITLNIDSSDIASKEWQSGYGFRDANSVTIAYATLLAAGSHTIKGRFFSNSGQTTTIDERQLITFCFPTETIAYGFKESTTSFSTASGSPINDSEATLMKTLAKSSDSLIIYVGGNPNGAIECREGKGILVTVDSADKSNSSSSQGPQARDYPDSAMSLWNEQLTAGLHTIQGKLFSNDPSSSFPTVTISHRQLLILAFPIQTANYRLSLNGAFKLDLSTYPLDHIQTVEIQLKYQANDTSENWYLKAYNWTATAYSDSGFNSTIGSTPSSGWDAYAVNLTDRWRSYVSDSGIMYVGFQENQADSNQTTVNIDFLAVRVAVDGAKFSFQNKGSLTCHLVSLWVNNSTHHQRYKINLFVNSGENSKYTRADINLLTKKFIVKVVTERGNIAVFSNY
jgi:hypothetical protein